MTHERPEEIERRLEQDRAALGATIDAIQQRLSPGQLLDQALGYMKTSGGEVASTLGRSARANPWPLVLTGVGLTWLIAATSTNGSRREVGNGAWDEDEAADASYFQALERAQSAAAEVQRQPEEEEGAFQSRLTEARAKALELRREANESAASFKARVDDYVRRMEGKAAEWRHRAGSAAQRAGAGFRHGAAALGDGARAVREGTAHTQQRAKELYEAQPLLAGAIGVMAGALLGALFPTSRAEDRMFGEYGQRVRDTAADAASEVAHESQAVAAETARAAAAAADESVRRRTAGETR